MNRVVLLAASAMCASPSMSAAQESPAPIAAPPAGSAQTGVLVYQPDFFASSSPNSALDMIQRLPGFTLDIGNSGARGLAGAQGNVLVDGQRPSSKTDNLQEVLRRIAASSVERIELVRGGAPGIDMQGRSVIANVVLRKTATTELALETNTYFYWDDYVGPSAKLQYSRREGDRQTEFAIFGTTDRTHNTARGRRVRYDAAGNVIQTAGIELWDRLRNGSVRGAVQRPFAGGKLRVNGLVEYTGTNATQDITIFSGAGIDDHSSYVSHDWNGELGLNWSRALGPRSELNLIALQRGNKNLYDSSTLNGAGGATEFDAEATGGESVFRTVLKFRPSGRWAFEGGGEVAYNFLDTASDYAQNGIAVPLPNARVRVSELRGEGFGQATWRPDSKLTVEAGMRVELSRISQTGDTDRSKSFVYPKPRVQLTWLPARGHQFRLRAEKSVSQLDFGDFTSSTEITLGTVIGGNADLEPQKTTTFEAVYEHRFWNKGVIELIATHQEIEDVIDVIPLVGGFDGVGNIGSGSFNALQSRLTLPLDKLGISNAVLAFRATVQRSQVVDPLTGERRRLSGEIPFGCGVDFNHDLKGGKFSYGFQHGCNQDVHTSYRVREERTIDYDPFTMLYGQWKPNPKFTLRVDLGQVFPYHLRNRRHLYTGPRNVSPLAYNEHRDVKVGRFLFVQARHVL